MPPEPKREQLGDYPGPQVLEKPATIVQGRKVTPVPVQQPPGNPLDKTRAKTLVLNRFDISRQASLLFFTKAARLYNLYRNKQVTKNYQGLANLFVPEPYRVVTKKTAKLANSIKKVKGLPGGSQFVDAAKGATHLLNYLRDKLGWKVTERMAIQESRIVGIGWVKILWNPKLETQEQPYKGFDVSFDSSDHVLFNPDATIQELFNGRSQWIIHQYEQSLDQLRQNPNYDQDAVDQLESLQPNTRPDSNIYTQSRVMFPQAQRSYQVNLQKKYQILEYWGKYPIEDVIDGQKRTREEEYLIVIANKNIVLRATPNPYAAILPDNPKPFVPFVGNIVGQESYPVGDLEPAESLFNELNDTRNQRMDTVTLNIDPPKLVLRNALIDEKDLVARRGWVIKTSVPNGIEFLPPALGGVDASIKEEEAIRGDIQQVTGILNFDQGTPVDAGINIDTAHGTVIAKNESDELTEDELEILKISLRMMYRIILSYAQNLLDKPFEIRVLEGGQQQFMQMSGQDLRGNVEIDVAMETLQDITTSQQMALMKFNQAKTVPGANIGKFFEDMLEAFSDEPINIQEYYQPPQPTPPEPPKISISLRGDLSPMESDEVFKTIPGVDPVAADPILRPEHRAMLKGQLPEDREDVTHTVNTARALAGGLMGNNNAQVPDNQA